MIFFFGQIKNFKWTEGIIFFIQRQFKKQILNCLWMKKICSLSYLGFKKVLIQARGIKVMYIISDEYTTV